MPADRDLAVAVARNHDLPQHRVGGRHLIVQHSRRVIQFVPQSDVQRKLRSQLPVILKEEMLVGHGLDAEAVARERAAALERNAEKKVGEGIAGIGSVEREIAAAAGRIRGAGVVPAQEDACLERVGAAGPHQAVVQFVFVVAELDGTECVGVEAQITGKPQPWETRKIRALFGEVADAGQHSMIGSQALRLVEKPGAYIVEPKLVERGRTEQVCLG